MIITFSGLNGAGKTLISKRLADHLGWQWWGMGDITRLDAKKRGMSIEEHDRFVADNPEIDRELDARLAQLGEERDDIVVDSRAGWHFIPHSTKVFLTADEDVRAKRAFAGARSSEQYASVQEAKEKLCSRVEVFRERLRELYGIDVYDPRNFDVVIDTSEKSPDEVFAELLARLQL